MIDVFKYAAQADVDVLFATIANDAFDYISEKIIDPNTEWGINRKYPGGVLIFTTLTDYVLENAPMRISFFITPIKGISKGTFSPPNNIKIVIQDIQGDPVEFAEQLTTEDLVTTFREREDTFIHEYIHYLDIHRHNISPHIFSTLAEKSSINDFGILGHVSSPLEFDAYYQEMLANTLKHIIYPTIDAVKNLDTDIDLQDEENATYFKEVIDALSTFQNFKTFLDLESLFDNMDEKYRQKYDKRLYAFYVYCLELFDKELSGIVSIGKESSLDELMKIAESMYPQLESLLEDMIDYLDRKYIQVALDFDGNVYEEIGYNKTDTTDKARAYLLRMRTHMDDLYRFRKWEFTQFLSVIREAIPDDLRWEAMCDELTKMLEVYF